MVRYKFKIIGFVLILFIFLVSLAYWFVHWHQNQKQSITMPASVISVIHVRNVPWSQNVNTVGTLKSDNAIDLTSQTTGIVEQIKFKSGDSVKQGQLLVILKHNAQAAALAKAQADYAGAEDLSQRYLAVAHTNAVSKTVIAQAQFQTKSAKATVMQAQAAFDDCFIRAPFTGQLGIRQVSIGQFINAGQNIVNLQTVPAQFVDFSVGENEDANLHVGDFVMLHNGTATQQASVSAISALVDESTRSFWVRATLIHPAKTLKPGGYVMVTVNSPLHKNVLEIPQTAINYEPYGASVYTVNKGKAYLQYVQIGPRFADKAVVISGLKLGQEVVTAGQDKLHDGAAVKISSDMGNSKKA